MPCMEPDSFLDCLSLFQHSADIAALERLLKNWPQKEKRSSCFQTVRTSGCFLPTALSSCAAAPE